MKLQDYAKTTEFGSYPPGLPVGDTFIDLDSTDFGEYEVKEKDGKTTKKTKATINGIEHYIPISVMRELLKIQEAGGKKARVTKQSTGKNKEDTRYTTIEVKI